MVVKPAILLSALVVTGALSASLDAAGQTPTFKTPIPPVAPRPAAPGRANPFQNLFDGAGPARPAVAFPQAKLPLLPGASGVDRERTRVVCGTTLVPVDPDFDADIRKPLPDNGTRFTIKAMPSPACER